MPTYLNNLYNLAGNGFVLMPMYLNNLYNLAGNGFVLMPMNLNSLYNLTGNGVVCYISYYHVISLYRLYILPWQIVD
jgi:hypothetical protein